MRLYFFDYPCYNLPDWKKSKRDQREHLLFFQSGSEEPKVLSVPEWTTWILARLVTFRNANSARFYLVLRSFEKHVLVTWIRKIKKVCLLGRAKLLRFTNFCLNTQTFYYGYLGGKIENGKSRTFAMANIIQQLNKPTLVIAHNKTLAAQLYGEFKEFFPENAVEYFVSY